ncbi:Cys-Gln thioester bond-forming surface protein [Blautia glucerasea]|uniref:SpaA isopeptide-forming pilin-related protein n=1 Tax=Blautia glucerasea TaxID=536633 RepID=UPI001D013E33|nr:SpaA isopeptide-forming pilin-related protein [Blautia glucerasea]MCB5388358.1 Cys-Gln thioester bond-forming surface protein [Blautia glucerasea]
MIKSKFKRVTSLFLATLMCVTTFAGIGSTTAYAASGEKADVYMVDFPRDGDANYDGVWGHSNLTLKNGWHTGRSYFTNLKAIGSYSGNVAYCIEPGISLKVGQTMNKYDENYFNNLASNGVISGDEIRLFVGRILQYGYRGTISTSWRSQNEAAANSIAQAYATQLLIWETVIGERDVNFNHVAASGCSNVKDVINAKHPLRNKIFSYYNSMVQSVQNHATIPSFCNKSSGSAKTIELEWNGSKYTTTLTDSNNVLSKYNFKASISGVSFSVNGNKLTVSMDTAPSKEFTITATKKNAVRRGVVVWSEGKHGQNSSVQDVVSYAQEVSDSINGYVKMKVSYGSCQIVKTSEDGKVDGINFTITGNGINQTVTTANGGKFQIDNLMPGIYTVTEQSYDKYEPQETHRVTVVAGQIAKVTFNNKLKRGDLQVVKSSEDNLVEGVKFHLFGTSLSGDAVDQYAVTDKNGVATFKDVLISGSEPYTLEEVDTAIRYVVPKNQTAPVKWKEVTTRNFNNILKKFTVTVTKSDAEKGEAQGNAKLSGAVYGIYKGETLVDKYVTDENGQFTTKEYVCDTDWTIREITPSEGYLLDKTIHEVGADPKLYEVEHNLTSNDVTEQVIKGNVAIIKHTDDGETKIETPEKGASFEIYLKSAGSYDAANKDERDTIVCDENGFGQTKDMPYGIYTVHQTSGWEGREMMDDFDVFISQNAQTYRYLINNRNFESFVNVVKVDAESGKSIPYAGAGFKIYDPQGNQVKMTFTYPTPTTIDVFYTDANGSLVTPEKLDYGKGYSIVEVQAPYGYVLDDTPVYFDITEENSTEEGGVTVVKVNKPNMAQKGTITVEKTGEVFSGVNVSGSEDSDVIYQPAYEVAGLEGAVYEVRAAEDISTPDGTLRYSKGEVVDTITTSSDGFVKSKELYLGKYEVKEITAPDGMVVSGETHTVELTYAGQNISVTETSTSFYNERQKVQVSLAKAIEKDKTFGIGDNGEIKNISFGLYAAEDIVSASGTVIPADGLIEIVSVNENGTAVMKSDLPFGKYYVKEIATDEHYILSDTKYPVVFEYAGQDTATVEIKVNDGKEIKNELIYGSVSGKKIDENGEALEGAVIGIFKAEETEFTKDTALMTTTSAKDGSFSFAKVPYGKWIVREIEQPKGFVLDEKAYEVNISKAEQVVEIEIVNEYVHGNIRLTKMDAEYPDNKLTGATFEVYKDTNENGKIDDGDELIGNLEETETGIYEMKELLYGKYIVRETKAPEGFLLDKGEYSVFIEKDETTYSVENKAGVGFINEAMRGTLKIVKTSSDGTQKMGAGTNVQDKLIALHDVDCPWRPSDLEQRSGRIVRQGNENPQVDIYRYVTEQTFDAYLYQLVEGKQKFASQIMTSKSPVRSAEDIDETALSYAEIKMLATGNPYIKEKMDLDIQVQKLKMLKSNFLSEKYGLEDKVIKFYPQQIAYLKSRVEGLTKDVETAKSHPKPIDEQPLGMMVSGVSYSEKAEAGQAIINACKSMNSPDAIPLGEYRGFQMELYFDTVQRNYVVKLKGETSRDVPLGDDAHGNIVRIDNGIERFEEALADTKNSLENTEKQFETAKQEIEKPFAKEEELRAKTARLDELNILLNMDKKENEIVGGEPDEGEAVGGRKEKSYER